MKKSINTKFLIVFVLVCFYAFTACHKLPKCEDGQAGTIVYYGYDCDTCHDDGNVYIILDEFVDTVKIYNKIQNRYIKNGLRVEVKWEFSSAAYDNGQIVYPNNWCGPKYPVWIDIKCIQLL